MNGAGWSAHRLSLLLGAVTLALGLLIGVGVYTFVYARGGSYLTDQPEACVNCHVMREQYAGWLKGSHRSVAVCNDCHTPDGVIEKYAAKAMYGFLHAYAFTTGRFPDEIQITPHMHAAQHPEFEMWNQGIHARSGVACADCHMPYKREGAMKISDHHVRSPLLNINRACQTCHKWPEAELKDRAEAIQHRTHELRNRALNALVALIQDLAATRKAGGSEQVLTRGQALQRKAQFMVDFVEAENSMGFHAPHEAARILAETIDYARQG